MSFQGFRNSDATVQSIQFLWIPGFRVFGRLQRDDVSRGGRFFAGKRAAREWGGRSDRAASGSRRRVSSVELPSRRQVVQENDNHALQGSALTVEGPGKQRDGEQQEPQQRKTAGGEAQRQELDRA